MIFEKAFNYSFCIHYTAEIFRNPLLGNKFVIHEFSAHLVKVFVRYWRIFVIRESVIREFFTHDKESISSGPPRSSVIREYPLFANPLFANFTVFEKYVF